ncbi:MAG TPA: TonB-dependent receptor plug domain-containing protein, partial [Myxococcaceae bacterium]|nr:TonB-dependent receptor plug domain-containing protein [Myxococcaceae bacterium]
PTLEETVTVVAPRREAPRPPTNPSSATQIQREDILSLPRGDSASVNEILALQPGFVFDSLGQLYVRGNHGNLQYQLDGVPLPESVSGLFGQFLSPKLVENIEVITGGLPAEYGQRLSGLVNLNSRRPPTEGEGQAELLYGSYATVTPSVFWGQKVGSVSYLTGGSFTWTNRGIDPSNPTSYVWDQSQQGRVFGKVDVDFNDRDHLTALIAYSHNQVQIPVDPTQVPGSTAEDAYGNPPAPYFPPNSRQTETENDLFGIVSYRHDFDATRSLRVAAVMRYSAASFFGDPAVVLGPSQEPCTPDVADCRGVSNLDRKATDLGLVADYLQRFGDQHTFKVGFTLNQLWGTSSYRTYTQLRTPTPPTPPPFFESAGQGTDSPTNTLGGAYAQDRWTLGKLTLTGGLRVDFQTVTLGGTSSTQAGVSPRLGAAYAFTPDVVAHGFIGLLWVPPSVLDVTAGARLTDAVPPDQPIPYTLRAEQDTYAEVGIRARVIPAISLGLTLWGRVSNDQLDETEVGNTGITTPYNFSQGRAGGIEATIDAVITQKLTAFGNVSFGTAQGRGISSATYLFSQADLKNKAWQTLDHAQTWTGNAGLAYREGDTLVSALFAFASGLRTGAGNASHVPGWGRVDLTLSHDFRNLPLRPMLAIDVINLFDATYAYRLYNGFNGSHWAPGRSVYVRAAVYF